MLSPQQQLSGKRGGAMSLFVTLCFPGESWQFLSQILHLQLVAGCHCCAIWSCSHSYLQANYSGSKPRKTDIYPFFFAEWWDGAGEKRTQLWRPPWEQWRACWWRARRERRSSATGEFRTGDHHLATWGSRGRNLPAAGRELSTAREKWRNVFSRMCSFPTKDTWMLAQRIVSTLVSSQKQDRSRTLSENSALYHPFHQAWTRSRNRETVAPHKWKGGLITGK